MLGNILDNIYVQPTDDLSEALKRTLARLVDPRVGIIQRVIELPANDGEAPLFVAVAECSNPSVIRAGSGSGTRFKIPSTGAAFSREQAIWSAIGEACERYAATQYAIDDLVHASWAEIRDSALPLDDLILFSDAQYSLPNFPFVPLDHNAPMRWVRGENLTRGKRALIPAQLVFLDYQEALRAEQIAPQISTGLAAGPSMQSAILSGLCEVIERDAFMCNWLLRRRLPKLASNVIHLPPMSGEGRAWRMTLLEATGDIPIPSVLAVLKLVNFGGFVVGMSCNLSAEAACHKAAVESFHTWHWAADMLRKGASCVEDRGVMTFADHVLRYLNRSQEVYIEEQIGSKNGPAMAGIARSLAELIDLVRCAGFEVYCCDLTTSDLKNVDMHVVKVIVPGLQPLNMGVDTVHLDRRRVEQYAERTGTPFPSAINLKPHPFP